MHRRTLLGSALAGAPLVSDTVPGFAATTWNAMLAPSGTPTAVVGVFSIAGAEVVVRPAFFARLLELGGRPMPTVSLPRKLRNGRFW